MVNQATPEQQRLEREILPTEETTPSPLRRIEEPFPGFRLDQRELESRAKSLQEESDRLELLASGLVARPRPATARPGVPRPTSGFSFIETFQLVAANVGEVILPRVLPSLRGQDIPDIFLPQIKTPVEVQEIVDAQEELKQQLLKVGDQSTVLFWKDYVLALSALIANPGNKDAPLTEDDFIQLVMNKPGVGPGWETSVTQEDIRWAGRIFIRALQERGADPPIELTPERKRNIVEQVSANRSASAYGLLVTTSADLLSALIGLQQPRFPEEAQTAGEFRDLLREQGYSEDETDLEIESYTSSIQTLIDQMGEDGMIRGLMRSEFSGLVLDDLERELNSKIIRGIVQAPLTTLMLPFDWWRSRVADPLLGLALKIRLPAGPQLPEVIGQFFPDPSGTFGTEAGEPFRATLLGSSRQEIESFDALFRQARVEGLGTWASLAYGARNHETNGFKRFVQEVALDPLSWVGLGLYAKPLRHLGPVGRFLAGAELGYMKAVDQLALKAKNTLYNIAPKTLDQVVNASTRAAVDTVKAALLRHQISQGNLFRSVAQIPLEAAQATASLAVRIAKQEPGAPHILGDMGRLVRRRVPLGLEEISTLTQRLGREAITEADIRQGFKVAELESFLGQTAGFEGKTIQLEEATQLIMNSLDVLDDAVGNRRQVVRRWLEDLIEGIDTRADDLISGSESTSNLFSRIGAHIDEVARAEQTSLVKLQNENLLSLSGSWILNDLPSKIIFGNLLARFNRGFARLHLMFAFYAPYNVAEGGIKTIYAGMNPFFNGNQVDRTLMKTSGLVGLPDQFLLGGGFNLQLGPTAQSLTLIKGGPPGISLNTLNRRFRVRRNAWQVFWGGLENVLRKSGDNIGLQQQANYLNLAMDRWFARNHGPMMVRKAEILDTWQPTLRAAGYSQEEVLWVLKEASERVEVNPETLLTMSVEFTPHKLSLRDTFKIIQKYPDIGPFTLNHLIDQAERGSLFPNLSRLLTEDMPELVRQEILHSPDLARIQFVKLMDEMVANPPVSLEDLRVRVQALQQLEVDTVNIVTMQTAQTQRYTRDILNLEVKGRFYIQMWDEILGPFIQESQERTRSYIGQLRSALDDPVLALTDAQRVQFELLLNRNLEHSALLLDSWEQHRLLVRRQFETRDALIKQIRSESGVPNIDHPLMRKWWDDFNLARETHWKTANLALAQSDSGVLEAAAAAENIRLPKAIDRSGQPLTAADISGLYDSIPSDLTRDIFIPEFGTIQDKQLWVERIFGRAQSIAAQGGKIPDDLGFSRGAIGAVYDDIVKGMLGSTDVFDLAAPRIRQLESMREELLQYSQRKGVLDLESRKTILDDFARSVRDDLDADPITRRFFGDDWVTERQKAFDDARSTFDLDFPDYNHPTAVNATFKQIYPFWTYAAHRAFWLPRTWIRSPGTFTALGRYQDATDKGYIPIPGTSWQVNPLRGLIYMGGLRGLFRRDFPEFYDRFPELSSSFDTLQRTGFYPNVTISAAFSVFGAKSPRGRLSEIGELLPSIVQTPLEAYVAAFPESEAAKVILELLLPSRFRDYQVSLAVSHLGGDGDAILTKRLTNTSLTKKEEKMWAAGQREFAVGGGLGGNLANMELALLRLQPAEKIAFANAAKQVIEECVGVPVAIQDLMRKAGERVSERFPIHAECKELVNELEGAQFRGLTTGLRESEIGKNLATINQFWSEIEAESNEVLLQQEALDRQWQRAEITRPRWEALTRELNGRIHQVIEDKREDDRFLMKFDDEKVTIPLTLQERKEFGAKHGFDPILQDAMEELVAEWFQIELRDRYDIALNLIVTDWDKFYLQRRIIEQSIPEPRRIEFLERVHKTDTDLERFRRRDNEEYIRPYREAREFVLETFSEEEQRIIGIAITTDDEDERRAMLQEEDAEGRNIVSRFRSELNEFRTNIRILDPQMDARLTLWEGLSPRSDRGLEAWRRLRQLYGFGAAELEAQTEQPIP